jgi:hypothetical protein
MKSKRLLTILLLAILLPTVLFVSCLKAGEDDPFISLRSRKARIAGEWKVTKAYYKTSYDRLPQISSQTINFENGNFTFSKYERDFTLQESRIDTSGKYEWNFEFSRSGSYMSVLTVNGAKREVLGSWEFASRDSISMVSSEFKPDLGFYNELKTFFYQGKYYVKELRHDKIVLFADNDFSTGELVDLELVLEPR